MNGCAIRFFYQKTDIVQKEKMFRKGEEK